MNKELLRSFDSAPFYLEKAEIKTAVIIHCTSKNQALPKEFIATEKYSLYSEDCESVNEKIVEVHNKSMIDLHKIITDDNYPDFINDYLFDEITKLVIHFKNLDECFESPVSVRLLPEEEKKELLLETCVNAYEQNFVLPKILYDETFSSTEELKNNLTNCNCKKNGSICKVCIIYLNKVLSLYEEKIIVEDVSETELYRYEKFLEDCDPMIFYTEITNASKNKKDISWIANKLGVSDRLIRLRIEDVKLSYPEIKPMISELS